MEVKGFKQYRVMHPRPVAVVVTVSSDGRVNGCAVSWFTPINVKPLVFAVSLAYKRLTYEFVKETGEITLNIVPASMLREVEFVGTVSGREVSDKLTHAGLRLEPSKKVRAPHIAGAVAYVEGKLLDELKYPDHALLTFEGLRVWADDKFFVNGIFTEDAKVLMHAGGRTYVKEYTYLELMQ